MIKFIYFDIGGVFINTSKYFTTVSHDFGLKRELFLQSFNEFKKELTIGTLSPQDFWLKMANEHMIPNNTAIKYNFLESWIADYTRIEFMHNLASQIAKKYKVGLLSNIYKGMLDRLFDLNLIPNLNFASIIDSSIVHMKKPDIQIFKFAGEKSGYKGCEIAYIDDKLDYLEGPSTLGWRQIRYSQYESELFLKQLQELGIW